MPATVEFLGNLRVKLIGTSDEHISRFHSRRGQRAGRNEMLDLVRELVVRPPLTRRAGSVPWMAPGAVRFLASYLRPDMAMLELGSGVSTAWYAARTARIISIEPDPAWATIVRERLEEVPNATLLTGTVSAHLPSLLTTELFDVIVVDHKDEPGMSRVDAVRAVLETHDHARCLVLDDSDRAAYAQAAPLLRGWQKHQFVGFRVRPMRLTETTIWIRS